MGDLAKDAATGAVNVAAHGIPIGTWGRKIGGNIMAEREFSKSMQTGAGLKLKDVGK